MHIWLDKPTLSYSKFLPKLLNFLRLFFYHIWRQSQNVAVSEFTNIAVILKREGYLLQFFTSTNQNAWNYNIKALIEQNLNWHLDVSLKTINITFSVNSWKRLVFQQLLLLNVTSTFARPFGCDVAQTIKMSLVCESSYTYSAETNHPNGFFWESLTWA